MTMLSSAIGTAMITAESITAWKSNFHQWAESARNRASRSASRKLMSARARPAGLAAQSTRRHIGLLGLDEVLKAFLTLALSFFDHLQVEVLELGEGRFGCHEPGVDDDDPDHQKRDEGPGEDIVQRGTNPNTSSDRITPTRAPRLSSKTE